MTLMYRVKPAGLGSVIVKDLSELISWLDSIQDSEDIEITTLEMDQQYYDSLPEFQGY